MVEVTDLQTTEALDARKQVDIILFSVCILSSRIDFISAAVSTHT